MDDDSKKDLKREELKNLYLQIKDCARCGLSGTRTNFVFGSGSSNAQILFIGEAPGKNEDIQGKPFVGQAGKLLDDLLASIDFNRTEVFIANVLKCRPPQNRDPNIAEIDTCKGYLFRQIEIIDPLIICTMGKYSTQLMLNTNEGIGKLRGKVFKKNGKVIIPINHPAAVLYAPSRIGILREDFKRLKLVYNNCNNKLSEADNNACDKRLESEGGIRIIDVAAEKSFEGDAKTENGSAKSSKKPYVNMLEGTETQEAKQNDDSGSADAARNQLGLF